MIKRLWLLRGATLFNDNMYTPDAPKVWHFPYASSHTFPYVHWGARVSQMMHAAIFSAIEPSALDAKIVHCHRPFSFGAITI